MLESLQTTKDKVLHYTKNKLRDVHLKELLIGSSSAFIFKIIGMLAGYVFTLFITRNFGSDGMGVFALSVTVLSIFTIFGRLGLDTTILRLVTEYSAQDKKQSIKYTYLLTLKIIVPFCLLLSVILYLLSPYIADKIFNKVFLEAYFRIISLAILPMVLIFINSQALRGIKNIKSFTFLQHIAIFLFSCITFSVLLPFVKDRSLSVISYVMGIFIVAAMSHIFWTKYFNFKSFSADNGIAVRDLFSISLPLLLSSSMSFVMHWTDIIMLGILKTEGEVGVYNVALRVASLTTICLFAVNSIAGPKLGEMYGKNDVSGMRKVAMQSAKLIFWTSIPILLIFFIMPSYILNLFGTEFKSGVYAFLILNCGQFINAVSGPVGYILIMTGKQKVHQNIIVVSAITNIVLNILLIPKYGINGAAIASMISIIFQNLTSVIYIKVHFNVITFYVPFFRRYVS